MRAPGVTRYRTDVLFVVAGLDHGDAVGECEREADAFAAVDRIFASDSDAAPDVGVIAYDTDGECLDGASSSGRL